MTLARIVVTSLILASFAAAAATACPECEKLAKAVNLIVDTQNAEGGWRYQPQRRDADISVTICQVMALRSARNAGLYVPPRTIERCIEYVKRSQNADGGFRYQNIGGSPSAFPRSAAALVSLYSAGVYEGRAIERGLKYVETYTPTGEIFRHESNYFYGHYYAVQAMWHAGGDWWKKWYPAMREELTAAVRDGRIDTLVVALTDMQGRLMGKRVQGQAFLSGAIDRGAHFCPYLLGTDMEMNTPDGFVLMNWETGYGDFKMVPDLSTLRTVPWIDKTAMVICDIHDEETNEPVEVAPRQSLKHQLERAAAEG